MLLDIEIVRLNVWGMEEPEQVAGALRLFDCSTRSTVTPFTHGERS